ncbi:conserved hypothetical protein [Hyella patelloides LEGE 07179]|uniref:TonB-dependent siderophore receptor n=1 Tax=Hyella patelloides LEGE 07179 TaxID=945734 RepID=A0A563W587_9CYAN|nr:TonB-dependent siderophore receptor [Hyella patelloides]VEP18862.1 conserved hypothetical protein [Hyella patelloides LEGE 07179]
MKALLVLLFRLLSIAGLSGGLLGIMVCSVQAEVVEANGRSPLQMSTASDLIAQGVTRVTGVTVDQTAEGLELILETAAGSERLVPLILPVGNNLVIDILDATLAFSIRNGVEELNPTPGITNVTVNKVNDNSIRVRITGENQVLSAEVVPSRDDLVLSVTPESATAKSEPDEEIEVIATGEAEDDGYNVTDSSVGTRTDTPRQDVPQSIQVIPQEVIEDQGAFNITEALRNVPGAVPAGSPRSVFDVPVIRGFGGFSATNDLFRRNGLRDPLGTSIGGDTANVERIEVLKGPASVLYGQGSVSGIVNIVTKQPLSEPFYQVEASIGNYDLYRGTLDFSGPINESGNLLYRLNIGAETAGNFVDFYDRDLFQIAPVLTWKIGKNTDLTFQAEYLSLNNPNYFGIPAIGTVLDNPNGDIPLEFNIAGEADSEKEIDVYRIGYNLEHRFSENWRIRNAFEAGFRQSSEFSISASSLQPDNRTLERSYFDSRNGFDINAYTLDTYTVGNFNTGAIEHELVAGIELSRVETITEDNASGSLSSIDLFDPDFSNTTLEPPTDFFDDKETVDGLGIYLQDQISFLDNFIVVLGGRFDIASVKNEDFINSTTEFQQNEAFSPRIGIVYKPIPDISLYASYSLSFQQETGRTFDNSISLFCHFPKQRSSRNRVYPSGK